MSLRVTVLAAVATLLVVAFALLAGLTMHISGMRSTVLVLQPDNAAPTVQAKVEGQPVLDRPAVFNQRFLIALSVIAAVTLSLALLLTNRLVLAPIVALTGAVRRMEHGALSEPVAVDRNDEIGELARSFNDLAMRLEESERRRKMLIADIAHELRTPLTNIRGSIESLQDGIVTASPAELKALHDDAMLLQRLILDLHELSTGDAGALRLELESADIGKVLATCVPDERVSLELADELPAINCDAGRIRQVVQNVVSNALRYPSAPPVRIRARGDGDGVRVDIEDGGPGFPPQEAAAIFQRFYRVDDSRSRETGGSGLGLAIAKQLVEAHGGRIGAFVNERAGATIWFTLPTPP
jgi:two-component system, OmpR family, sensor histidine kinase BaeS